MKFALIRDDNVERIIEIDSEDQLAEYILQYQNCIEITDINPSPQVGWKFQHNKLVPSVDKGTVEYVLNLVYDPLVAEFTKIRRQFIAENIYWGITQLGKTRLVGDFMEPIEKWFNRTAPIEAITEIEIAKAKLNADATLAASLYPFVTIDRLNWYKTSILTAVAKTQG